MLLDYHSNLTIISWREGLLTNENDVSLGKPVICIWLRLSWGSRATKYLEDFFSSCHEQLYCTARYIFSEIRIDTYFLRLALQNKFLETNMTVFLVYVTF